MHSHKIKNLLLGEKEAGIPKADNPSREGET
jgi:hypothetical protein